MLKALTDTSKASSSPVKLPLPPQQLLTSLAKIVQHAAHIVFLNLAKVRCQMHSVPLCLLKSAFKRNLKQERICTIQLNSQCQLSNSLKDRSLMEQKELAAVDQKTTQIQDNATREAKERAGAEDDFKKESEAFLKARVTESRKEVPAPLQARFETARRLFLKAVGDCSEAHRALDQINSQRKALQTNNHLTLKEIKSSESLKQTLQEKLRQAEKKTKIAQQKYTTRAQYQKELHQALDLRIVKQQQKLQVAFYQARRAFRF